MRDVFVSLSKKKKEEAKLEQQRQNEASFRRSVDMFRKNTTKKAAAKISNRLGIPSDQVETVENILVGLSLQFSCLIFLKGYHGKMFNWFPSRKKKKSKPVCVCV